MREEMIKEFTAIMEELGKVAVFLTRESVASRVESAFIIGRVHTLCLYNIEVLKALPDENPKCKTVLHD